MKLKNKYYAFYNKDGLKAKIKISKKSKGFEKERQVLLKFKRPTDSLWLFYYPNQMFNNYLDVIEHIIENLETDNVKFKII